MGNDEKELVLRLSAAIARLKEITDAPHGVFTIPGTDRLAVKRDTVLMAQYRLAEAASTIERLSAIEQERDALRQERDILREALTKATDRIRAALLHEGQG